MKIEGEKNVADYEAFGVNVILEKKDDSDSNEFITLSFYWLVLLSFFIIL